MEATTTIRNKEKDAGEDDAVTRSLKLLDVIRSAIKAGDVETIRETGDVLKGCITAVLAKEALTAASALEKAEHEDDLGRAQDACQRLRAAIGSLNPLPHGRGSVAHGID
jgi:hypothetical protein